MRDWDQVTCLQHVTLQHAASHPPSDLHPTFHSDPRQKKYSQAINYTGLDQIVVVCPLGTNLWRGKGEIGAERCHRRGQAGQRCRRGGPAGSRCRRPSEALRLAAAVISAAEPPRDPAPPSRRGTRRAPSCARKQRRAAAVHGGAPP